MDLGNFKVRINPRINYRQIFTAAQCANKRFQIPETTVGIIRHSPEISCAPPFLARRRTGNYHLLSIEAIPNNELGILELTRQSGPGYFTGGHDQAIIRGEPIRPAGHQILGIQPDEAPKSD